MLCELFKIELTDDNVKNIMMDGHVHSAEGLTSYVLGNAQEITLVLQRLVKLNIIQTNDDIERHNRYYWLKPNNSVTGKRSLNLMQGEFKEYDLFKYANLNKRG